MKFSTKKFIKVYDAQHGRCFYCADELMPGQTEIDHFLPFSKYRNGKAENLVLSCKSCNRLKRDFEILEFKRIFISKFPQKLIRGMFYFEFLKLK